MTQNAKKVVVVGGGVIGTSCAYFLAKSGCDVTILEQNSFGAGCSHGNCGVVTPSHVLPLAVPGAWWMGLKSLFQKNSPLKVRFRLDWSLWSWLTHFALSCTNKQMMSSGHAIQALLNSSRSLYQQLMDAGELDCEWETKGLLFVFQSESGMNHYAETDHLLRDSFQMPATRYDAKELLALEPTLKEGIAGAWHYELDAQLRPDRLMASWQERCRGLGVTLMEKVSMTGFTQANGHATAVSTNQGEFPADAIVIATGALTPLLNKHLGCKIPIQPGKGYSITMPRPAHCPKYPMIFEEHRVAVTPMQSGYRLGSTMEFAGYDATLNPDRLQLLKDGAAHYLREPYGEIVEQEWFGWRPMTYDSKPIIDRCPIYDNVFLAAGHSMLGVSMAPATGQLVCEMLTDETPHIDPRPYEVGRF